MRSRRPFLEALESRELLANGVPTPDHVVVVIEENHPFSAIIGNGAAPYLNSLAGGPNSALFTQSRGIEHPSQPNYIDLFSGSNQGVTSNQTPTGLPFTAPNLGAALLAKSLTFAGYSEDLPSVGFTGDSSGNYVRRHNPWVNWQGTGTNGLPSNVNQPLSAFTATAYDQLPTVSFIVPTVTNDMHDGSIATGDAWLKAKVDGYVQWATTHNSLLIVTFDEDDGSAGNQIATLFVGPMVQGGQYAEPINHFNVLRTIEDMYGLSYAGKSATAAAITDCWVGLPSSPGPSAWNYLGGGLTQIVSATSVTGGVELFGISPGGAAFANLQSSAGGPYSGWVDLGGFVKQITVGTNQDGTLTLFGVGGDDGAWYRKQNSPGDLSFGPWTSLGGYVTQLAAGRDASGAVTLFGIGGKNALWYRTQSGPNQSAFVGWRALDGFVKQITVGANADGTLQVFGVGGDNGAWFRKQVSPANLTFGAWTPLGGYVTQLAVGLDTQNHLTLFGIGGGSALFVRTQTDGTGLNFSSWTGLGGVVKQIAVGANKDGTLSVFGIGGDNAAWVRKQKSAVDLAFSAWATLGGFVKQLATGVEGDGALDLIAIGGDNAAYWRR